MISKNDDLSQDDKKAKMIAKFEKTSIASSIADFLRNALINGLYKPGERLKEKDITKELNVSRTPLREAFRILQSEGLLNYSSHHGVIVTPICKEDIKNLWEIRFALEIMATEKAIDNLTVQNIEELSNIQDQIEKLDSNDKANIIQKNTFFHMYIINAAGNERLINIIKTTWTQIQVIQAVSLFKEGRFEKSCFEHRQLISAIKLKDKELARSYMQYHLKKGKEALLNG